MATTRRDAIRRLAVGGAAAAAAPFWVESLLATADQHAAHQAAPPAAAAPWTPKVLDPRQNELVTVVSELIIPQTETPGATAAHVNQYIDAVLAEATPGVRDAFLQGIAWLDLRSESRFGARFVNAPPARQIELLTELSHATSPSAEDKPGADFFTAIKGMTITGYYTSEVGLKEEIGDDGQLFFTEFQGCTHEEHGAPRAKP
jgi:Gluconate 2-dehydrogenase subunit 3